MTFDLITPTSIFLHYHHSFFKKSLKRPRKFSDLRINLENLEERKSIKNFKAKIFLNHLNDSAITGKPQKSYQKLFTSSRHDND